MTATLAEVKKALGIEGSYQDAAVQTYFDEVVSFLRNAGVPDSAITSGIVSIGVSDLWRNVSGEHKLSQYFIQRAAQLALR